MGRRIHFFASGSRGDVQPMVYLCLAYLESCAENGIDVKGILITQENYVNWIEQLKGEKIDLEIRDSGSDVEQFLRNEKIAEAIVMNDMFKILGGKGMKEESKTYVVDLLGTFDELCHDVELIVTNICTHAIATAVAEKRGVPQCVISFLPWHPNRYFPSTFLFQKPFPFQFLNKISYAVSHRLMFYSSKEPHNEGRKRIGIGPKTFASYMADQRNLPFLLAASPTVVGPCDDPDVKNVTVSGYILMEDFEMDVVKDRGARLPSDLEEFLERDLTRKPVYIGFGSMPVQSAKKYLPLMRQLFEICPDERFIVYEGGVDPTSTETLDDRDKYGEDVADRVFLISSVKHHLLFPRCSAIIHHGGAGSTAAALMSGTPSAIIAVFGDQPYWSYRLQQLGLPSPSSIRFKSVTSHDLKWIIDQSKTESVIQRAKEIREAMRLEKGLQRAVEWLHQQIGP